MSDRYVVPKGIPIATVPLATDLDLDGHVLRFWAVDAFRECLLVHCVLTFQPGTLPEPVVIHQVSGLADGKPPYMPWFTMDAISEHRLPVNVRTDHQWFSGDAPHWDIELVVSDEGRPIVPPIWLNIRSLDLMEVANHRMESRWATAGNWTVEIVAGR